MRLKALNGQPVWCRPHTTDLAVFIEVFLRRYHLPPPDLTQPGAILDLGSNIGLTMASYACLFPSARILGVELDGRNVEMCSRNIAPFADRCQVLHGAVWNTDGQVPYAGDQEWGFHVSFDQPPRGRAAAYSLLTLIRRMGVDVVDFVKMDIEGAERQVLESSAPWIPLVRCLKVEVHAPYTTGDCVRNLETLGMRCELDALHRACVVARNPGWP